MRIERHNDRIPYIVMLTAFTAGFAFSMSMFVRPFFHGAGVKDLPATDVTEIKAVTPRHTLSNGVEFTARGRHSSIGDILSRDEANELAHELNHRISLAG